MRQPKAVHAEILTGWKDIAKYLGMGVRTVQRYEQEHGLPIRRPAGRHKSSVIAVKAELDGWVTAAPLRESFRLSPVALDQDALLKEFRRNIAELHRLRQETSELRKTLHSSMELLRNQLRSAVVRQAQRPSWEHRELADVLRFDSKKKVQ